MNQKLVKELTEFFEDYVTPHKRDLITEILNNRTRHLTVVLEDIFKPHNASAVIRTSECMGIQDLHVVENVNDYVPNPYVTRGATKWLNIFSYSDTNSCIHRLKQDGYRILATTLDEKAVSYKEYDITQKTAIVFGTEFSGVSEDIIAAADDFIYIPMVGFTESLNISVSAAIILEEFSSKVKASSVDWALSNDEKNDLRLAWYKNLVKRSELLEERYLSENN